MAWIETVDEDAAGGELAGLYAAARDPQFRRVDHVLTIHSLHPAGLRAHLELYRAVMRGTPTLPKLERELIALCVSRLNRCHY